MPKKNAGTRIDRLNGFIYLTFINRTVSGIKIYIDKMKREQERDTDDK
jgi:hypothetical protein